MLNIEIHGFERKIAEHWRAQILRASKNKSFWGKMVVEIYPTDINEDAPFIRLVSTIDEMMEAIGVLGAFKIDIQVLLLDHFIKGSGNFSRQSPPCTNY